MSRLTQLAATACMAFYIAAGSAQADTWKMDGVKQVNLHTTDGQTIPIGTVTFTPQQGDQATFKIDFATKPFTVFFLSMRNFNCIDGKDIECIVPYPYKNPMTASPKNLDWLADNFLFMFKTKAELGAIMNNGVRFDMKLTDHGISGKPQAINLDDISSPPPDKTVPPYPPSSRDDYADGNRWISEITIE